MFILIGFIWLLHPNVCNFFLLNNSQKSGFNWLLFQALQLDYIRKNVAVNVQSIIHFLTII